METMETPQFPTDIFKHDFMDVYEPAEDTFLLIDAIENDLDYIVNQMNPLICLEVGCGSGAVITSLAKALGPNKCLYLATDINSKAVLTTQKCCKVNGIEGKVELVVSDLASAFQDRLAKSVDLLIFNPPYVPTMSDEVGSRQISSSWAGGLNGREVIDRFLRDTVAELLSPNGSLYLIIIKENNIDHICATMKRMGFHMTILAHRKSGSEYLMALRFNRI